MLDRRVPNADDLISAENRLRGMVVNTPVVRSDRLDRLSGARIFIKLENHQHTNSFKYRGAYNCLAQLDPQVCTDGVVAYSTGNHGQAVAKVGRLLNVATTIVVPSDVAENKVERAKSYGAAVVYYDRLTQRREHVAADVASNGAYSLVPPGDHPDVIAGQGTVVLEALRQLGANNIDVIIVPCGGGSLSAGTCIAVDAMSTRAEVWAVEPVGFDDTRRSLETGKRESNEIGRFSVCDALLANMPAELPFEINRRRLSGVITAFDQEVESAMAFCFADLRTVLEPGGAIGIAALLSGRYSRLIRGKRVLVVASGGNVDPAHFASVIMSSGYSSRGNSAPSFKLHEKVHSMI